MTHHVSSSLILLGALSFALACEQDAGKGPQPSTVETSKTESAKPAGPADVTAVLGAYENVRSALAQDDFATATTGATALRDAARRANLGELVTLAEGLAKRSPEDAESVRVAFGDISRVLIATLSDREDLRASLHVFECPMAKGFGKWVQRDKDKQNPYMGKSMPTCGSESDW